MTRTANQATRPTLPTHGASILPSVKVDSYNLEIEDQDGFVGDKASKGAFRELLEEVRATLRKTGTDPLGTKPSDEISKKKLEAVLARGGAEAGAVAADPRAAVRGGARGVGPGGARGDRAPVRAAGGVDVR